MPTYKFITYWKLNTTVEEVWNLISDISKWHEWWHGVLEVKVLKTGNDHNLGASFAHTWRSFIPYKLQFVTEVTEIKPYDCIQATVTGELEGTGRWEFRDDGQGGTTVTYFWFVRTTRLWMNLTAPFLSGLFRWNHDTVMRWGGEGVSKKLKCDVTFDSAWIH